MMRAHLCVTAELQNLQALEGGEALLQRLCADAPALCQFEHPANITLTSIHPFTHQSMSCLAHAAVFPRQMDVSTCPVNE
jgi:hypothetical protein